MKKRIFVAAMLVMLFSVGINNTASAHPWGWRGGWCGPHVAVRVGVPVPPIVVGGYYGPGYAYGPAYYGHPYGYGGGYYHRPYAYGYGHPHYGYGPGHYGHYGPRRY
jgi:hypothetical protein